MSQPRPVLPFHSPSCMDASSSTTSGAVEAPKAISHAATLSYGVLNFYGSKQFIERILHVRPWRQFRWTVQNVEIKGSILVRSDMCCRTSYSPTNVVGCGSHAWRGVKGKQRARLSCHKPGLHHSARWFLKTSETVATQHWLQQVHSYAECNHHRSALLWFAHSPLHHLSCPARYQAVHKPFSI